MVKNTDVSVPDAVFNFLKPKIDTFLSTEATKKAFDEKREMILLIFCLAYKNRFPSLNWELLGFSLSQKEALELCELFSKKFKYSSFNEAICSLRRGDFSQKHPEL